MSQDPTITRTQRNQVVKSRWRMNAFGESFRRESVKIMTFISHFIKHYHIYKYFCLTRDVQWHYSVSVMNPPPRISHGPTLITSVFFPRKKESPCGETHIQSVKANRVPIPIKTGTSVRQGFDAQCLHPLMIPSRFAVSEERFHYRTGSKWASRITVQRDSHEITKTGWGDSSVI